MPICTIPTKAETPWNSKGFLVELLTRVELVTSSLPRRARGVFWCLFLSCFDTVNHWNFNAFRLLVVFSCCACISQYVIDFLGVS